LKLPDIGDSGFRASCSEAGARVSALAGPNDVLVSSTLRDLVIGSGLEFDCERNGLTIHFDDDSLTFDR
jgi:hypothetical protein